MRLKLFLLFLIASLVFAQAIQAVEIIPGSSLPFNPTGLLPNQTVTIYVWKLTENPLSNSKIGLAGVFLPWENGSYINGVLNTPFNDALNRNYGDKLLGTADDVTADLQMEKHLQMLRYAGVKTIGFGIAWKEVEWQNNNWTWTVVYDKVFRKIKSFEDRYNYRFEPVVMLDAPPRWATSAKPQSTPYISSFAKFPPKDLWTVPIWDSATDPTPNNPDDNLNPNGSAEYNQFVTEAVKRYRPRGTLEPTSDFGIKHWVIWNEANWEFFKDPSDEVGNRYMPTMKPYAYLLRGAKQAIKTVDPSLLVLSSGFADGDYTWLTADQKFGDGQIRSLEITSQKFYQEVQALASRPDTNDDYRTYFDILNVHSYKPMSVFSTKFATIATIKQNFADSLKKIWVTEWGCDAFECRDGTLDQLLTEMKNKWLSGKTFFDGRADIEKHTWWASRGYFTDDLDAQAAKYLIPTTGRETNQWNIFAGMMYASFKPKPGFTEVAKNTNSLETEQILTTQTTANGDLGSFSIPGTYFSQVGKYVVLFSQDERINTETPQEVIVALPSPTPTPTPTTIPFWNFETSNDSSPIGDWSGKTAATPANCDVVLDTASYTEGTASYRADKSSNNNSSCFVYKDAGGNNVFHRVVADFRFDSIPSANNAILAISQNGNSINHSYVVLRTDRKLHVYNFPTNSFHGPISTPLEVNTWYRLEFILYLDDTNGYFTLKVDNESTNFHQTLFTSGIDTKSGTVAAGRLNVGQYSQNSWATDTLYDHVRWLWGSSSRCLPLGDINCIDGVEVKDLSFLISKFTASDFISDLDNSGKVNALDLSILLSNY